MHYRNPIKISQPPLPTQSQLLAYDNLSKVELMSLLKTRDQELVQNKDYLRNAQNEYNQKMGIYKLRIQEEINQNEKAVKAFGNITELIITIISKFEGFDRITNRESLASIANTIRSTLNSRPASFSKSLEQELNQSEFSCIDEIAFETIKLLEYLSKLTEDMVKANMNLRAEFTNRIIPTQHKINHFSKNPKAYKQAQVNLNQTQKIFKDQIMQVDIEIKQSARMPEDSINKWTEQLTALKQQIKLKVYESKKLKKLLQDEQKRRLEILKSIANSLSEQTVIKVTNMNREELLEHIKLMNYRIKELEKDKRQMFAKSKVEREIDQKRFQELLSQLKQFKSKKINMTSF